MCLLPCLCVCVCACLCVCKLIVMQVSPNCSAALGNPVLYICIQSLFITSSIFTSLLYLVSNRNSSFETFSSETLSKKFTCCRWLAQGKSKAHLQNETLEWKQPGNVTKGDNHERSWFILTHVNQKGDKDTASCSNGQYRLDLFAG